MCLYPTLIKNRKYTANKKNGGVIPAVSDPRVLYVPVPCGKCMECKKQKANEWRVRMLEELRTKQKYKPEFVTMTFSNEAVTKLADGLWRLTGYELDNEIATKAVRLWLERIRKETGKSVKHWLVTELGHNGTENIHLHGIVWGDKEIYKKQWEKHYGWFDIGRKGVAENTVNYIVKYVTKTDEDHKEYNAKILCSPRLGSGYLKRFDAKLNKYKPEETKTTYTTTTGHEMSLPTYYRNHLYTDEEKEKLWLELLDKQERWVLGKRVDISKDEEQYYKRLKQAQKLNKQLGYGTNEINWERRSYENERRNINYRKRKGI